MHEYAAVLGHQPVISLAELAATVPGFATKRTTGKQIVTFESSEILPANFIDTLGGTLFLARRISDAPLTLEDVPQALVNETATVKKKVTFSLRCEGLSPKSVTDLYRQCKERFRREGRPCRYVGNERKPAIAALLHDADIVSGKKGCELFLIAGDGDLWVGRTVGAQDVDAYTKRDTEKPVRDTCVGLLPPKLAQVMLNFGAWIIRDDGGYSPPPSSGGGGDTPPLSSVGGGMHKRKHKETYTVFDPFCGTGVIPLESMLRGWNALASDASIKAMNGCVKNIEWLRKEYGILKKDVTAQVWKQDAIKPFVLKKLPDIIVTETTLGPTLTKLPGKSAVVRLAKENAKLQTAFLKNAAASLPGVPVVCTWPVWKTTEETVMLEEPWDAIFACGYSPVMPAGIEPTVPNRLSLVYRRKDQFVGREILLLKPRRG